VHSVSKQASKTQPLMDVTIHVPDVPGNGTPYVQLVDHAVPKGRELLPLDAARPPGEPDEAVAQLVRDNAPLLATIGSYLPPHTRLSYMVAVPEAGSACNKLVETRAQGEAWRTIGDLGARNKVLQRRIDLLARTRDRLLSHPNGAFFAAMITSPVTGLAWVASNQLHDTGAITDDTFSQVSSVLTFAAVAQGATFAYALSGQALDIFIDRAQAELKRNTLAIQQAGSAFQEPA